jgi:hypothetical protein
VLEAANPSVSQSAYLAWFAALLDVRAPHAQSELLVNGTYHGTLTLALDAAPAIQELWRWLRVSPCSRWPAWPASCRVRCCLVNLRGLYDPAHGGAGDRAR